MKKILFILVAALAMSCQKPETPADQNPDNPVNTQPGQGVKMSLSASIVVDKTKVGVAEEADVLKVTWVAGDAISILTYDANNKLITNDVFYLTSTPNGTNVGTFEGEFFGNLGIFDDTVQGKVLCYYPALRDGAGTADDPWGSPVAIDNRRTLSNFIVGSDTFNFDLLWDIEGNQGIQKGIAFGNANNLASSVIMSGLVTKGERNVLNVKLQQRTAVLKFNLSLTDCADLSTLNSFEFSTSTNDSYSVKGTASLGEEEEDLPGQYLALANNSQTGNNMTVTLNNISKGSDPNNKTSFYIPIILPKQFSTNDKWEIALNPNSDAPESTTYYNYDKLTFQTPTTFVAGTCYNIYVDKFTPKVSQRSTGNFSDFISEQWSSSSY